MQRTSIAPAGEPRLRGADPEAGLIGAELVFGAKPCSFSVRLSVRCLSGVRPVSGASVRRADKFAILPRVSADLALARGLPRGSLMTADEDTVTPDEPLPYKALIEDLETQIDVIGEAHAANSERIDATRAELEAQIRTNDRRIMEVDVRITQQVAALDAAIHAELGKLDRKTDDLGQRLVALDRELARIAAHVGLGEAAPKPDRAGA